jgi:hypothetical protein
VLGAVVGAAAGAAIDSSDGAGNREVRPAYRAAYRGDYCEQYFDYYTRSASYGGWGHGGMMVMMVPVAAQGQGHRHCTETVVTEEYTTVRQRARRHHYRRPARPVPDKRLRMD